MLLGGVPIEDRIVLRLARVVADASLAAKLNMAYTLRSEVVNLTYPERQAIIAALEQRPDGLDGLHELLVANHAWQLRQRLEPGVG